MKTLQSLVTTCLITGITAVSLGQVFASPITVNTGMPNISNCAVANFPKEAKKYVIKALVRVSIVVDKKGKVRDVKALDVQLLKVTDEEKAKETIALFEKAGIDSLLGRICPIYSVDGEPKPYRLEVPLLYELYDL